MATTRIADNDGVRIAYESRPVPDGPWTVLVHGLGYPRQGWGPLVDALAGKLSLVLIDNRGIGGSDVPEGPYDAQMMAGDVAAVLDDLGLETAHVVGTSLGGMIAQELAITRPERVDRLVLLAATPGGDAAVPIPETTQALLAEAPQLEPLEALQRLVANAFGPDADPALVEQIVRMRTDTAQSMDGWQAQAAAGTTYDGGGRESAITAPTLLVHGTHDVVVDPANSSLLDERIPDSRLIWIEHGGHLVFWEQPERIARLIIDHLTGDDTDDAAATSAGPGA